MKTYLFLYVCTPLLLSACDFGDRTEQNLSEKDIEYIDAVILPIADDEEIQLFETNGGLKGFKTSGNFITNKRLVSYWIDDKTNEVYAIAYDQIDSLKPVDRTAALSYASYIQVYSSSVTDFKVYVDADSTRTWAFFNKALGNWENRN